MTRRVLLVLLAWVTVTVIPSFLGLHEDRLAYPTPLPVLIAVPVIAYLTWYNRSPEFRAFVWAVDLRYVALAQTMRCAGVIIIPLIGRTNWPKSFAQPVFIMDLAFGLTAPLVAWAMNRSPFPRNLVVTWNVLGVVHLTTVTVLRALTARAAWGIWADNTVSTIELSQFPLSILVAFFVPLLIIGNLVTLHQIHDAPQWRGAGLA